MANVTIQRSTGSVLATVKEDTAHRMVKIGHATIVTPGATGVDVVKLVSATLDTQYAAATTGAPILHGVSDITFLPTQFPEPTTR